MGACATKRTGKKQLTLSTRFASCDALKTDKSKKNASFTYLNSSKIQMNSTIQESDKNESCSKERVKDIYVSCYVDGVEKDDPIAMIVRLEQACIKLKSKMEGEKQKKQESAQGNINSFGNQGGMSHNSTRNSLDQTPSSISNEVQCFSTIIKLADFIQEKSQRLWENPQDDEVQDAIASLFWATNMLQLPCLIEFKTTVEKEINKMRSSSGDHLHLLPINEKVESAIAQEWSESC